MYSFRAFKCVHIFFFLVFLVGCLGGRFVLFAAAEKAMGISLSLYFLFIFPNKNTIKKIKNNNINLQVPCLQLWHERCSQGWLWGWEHFFHNLWRCTKAHWNGKLMRFAGRSVRRFPSPISWNSTSGYFPSSTVNTEKMTFRSHFCREKGGIFTFAYHQCSSY